MKKVKSFSIFYCIFIGLIIACLVKLFLIELLTVDGSSMKPTLKDKQTIFVNKAAYGIPNPFGAELLVQWAEPKPGDVVIYLYKNNLVVKRCVATQNAPLDYLTNSSYILLVERNLQIPLTEEQYQNLKNCSSVPENYILAVGDNYEESFDSRNYGFIPVTNVLGKVICKQYPLYPDMRNPVCILSILIPKD